MAQTELFVVPRGARATPIGLELGSDLTEPEWEQIGRAIGRLHTAYQWIVGDWWVYGIKWGNKRKLVQSPDWTGASYQSCIAYGVVCRAFELHCRRSNLSFTHHAELAALKGTNPVLAEQLLDWCEAPLKAGKKKPRSAANLRAEISRHLNGKTATGMKTRGHSSDYRYIDFIGPIHEMARARAEFDLGLLASLADPELLAEDLAACHVVIEVLNQFINKAEQQNPSSCLTQEIGCGSSLVESSMN